MEIVKTKFENVYIVKSQIFFDERGFFTETFNVENLLKLGINFTPVQVNHSNNKKEGTIRGLHFQVKPFAQAKIVTCLKGAIFDVAVDLNPRRPTFLKYLSFLILGSFADLTTLSDIELPPYDYLLKYPDKVYLPRGFAHGFMSLLPDTDVLYFTDNYYSKMHERAIRFDDPKIGIQWPKLRSEYILSEKDANAPMFNDIDFTNYKIV
jgi:dTDP-4-dehydrorhamnose 3,5-epimerase-like enzyme